MILMPFDVVFLVIVLFGLLTSYTDIKQGKIKNIHVLLLIAAAVFVNVLITKSFIEMPLETAINFLVALLLSFGMYYRGLWSEGDAKLFSAFALLLPVNSYVYHPLAFFPALNILINTFVPAALFFVLFSFRSSKFSSIKETAKDTLSFPNLARSALFLFGFVYLINLAGSYFGFNLGPFVTVLVIILLSEILAKIHKSMVLYSSLLFSGLHIIFGFSSLNVGFWYNFALLFALLMLVRLVVSISYSDFYKERKSKKGKKIAKAPFAPFLFFGVLFTYLTGADIFFVLFRLL